MLPIRLSPHGTEGSSAAHSDVIRPLPRSMRSSQILEATHASCRTTTRPCRCMPLNSEPNPTASCFSIARDTDGSSHASLYCDVISEIHQQDVTHTIVQITTLDDVTSALGIRQVDFLKVDVEGHEIQVLQGGEQLIASDSIRYVQFEFNEMNVVSGTTMRDFRLALPRHQLFRLLPKGLIPLEDSIFLSELYAYQNIIAVPVGDLDDTL